MNAVQMRIRKERAERIANSLIEHCAKMNGPRHAVRVSTQYDIDLELALTRVADRVESFGDRVVFTGKLYNENWIVILDSDSE